MHDATYRDFQYCNVEKMIMIHLHNPCYKFASVGLRFCGVKLLVSLANDPWGTFDETINTLWLEEDTTLPRTLLSGEGGNVDDMLYFVFEMFSGNKIYILCDEFGMDAIYGQENICGDYGGDEQ